jgi:ribosome-binding factor A
MVRGAQRGGGQRPLRVGEELRHALAEIFARAEFNDPDLATTSITVSEVRVSPDLRCATAFVLPLAGADGERILGGLRRSVPHLRMRLARQLALKRMPELEFDLDRAFEAAAHIDALLRRPDIARDLESTAEAHGEPDGS